MPVLTSICSLRVSVSGSQPLALLLCAVTERRAYLCVCIQRLVKQHKNTMFTLAANAGSLHPRIPADCLAHMVSFLKALHEGANTQRSFASAGGPWEFNLRDLLRWCDLAEAAVPAHDSSAGLAIEAAVEHFSQMLFFERLRTPQDRQHLLQLYQECWGHPLPLTPTPELTICPASVKLGWATLPRILSHADFTSCPAHDGKSGLSRSTSSCST